MSIEEKVAQAIEDAGLVQAESVPQNLYGINPVARKRPYMGDLASRDAYMKFMGYERGVLTARIAELNSRAEQILYIYLCRVNQAYLVISDRSRVTSRTNDSYFYEWLDELAVQGIAFAEKRKSNEPYKMFTYQWDSIQKTLELCMSKGLDIETSAKVASIGVKAVEKYLRSGIISMDEMSDVRSVSADAIAPPDNLTQEIERERQADILKELADTNSSRGASILARDRIGTDFVRISAINRDENSDVPGFVRYNIEVQIVKRDMTYTPYETRFYAKEDVPIQAVKFALAKLSESLSRIL